MTCQVLFVPSFIHFFITHSFIIIFFFNLIMTRKIHTKEFLAMGISLIHRHDNAYSSYARIYESIGDPIKKIELEEFESVFGVSPYVCRSAWNLLHKHSLLPNGGLPQHLLWALMFMKLYRSGNVLSSMAGCSRKTYMKWTWKFVRRIGALKAIVVSSLNKKYYFEHVLLAR